MIWELTSCDEGDDERRAALLSEGWEPFGVSGGARYREAVRYHFRRVAADQRNEPDLLDAEHA